MGLSSFKTSDSISSYNIAGLIPKDSEEVATQLKKDFHRQQPHSPRGTATNIPIHLVTLYFQKLESLDYIFVADSMGLSSFKFVQWAPKDASFLRQSAFWSFKVIQG